MRKRTHSPLGIHFLWDRAARRAGSGISPRKATAISRPAPRRTPAPDRTRRPSRRRLRRRSSATYLYGCPEQVNPRDRIISRSYLGRARLVVRNNEPNKHVRPLKDHDRGDSIVIESLARFKEKMCAIIFHLRTCKENLQF